ncbi:fungal-specific transcription factor domain-containing protein [Cytidiella melzeri]|nr:fungal-specific transcription factor domain-containing protein [Cytidiella melzeri]
MAHMIPQHQEMNIQGHPSHPTLQAALQIDPNHPPPPHMQAQQGPAQSNTRKRKKVEGENGEPSTPAEPRRLRRSHEACARCRSKKIKASPVGRHRRQIPCDSKHPRCTACASAGVQCQQEDRHRQALVDRGHTEHVERQNQLCAALLKRHYPNFDLNDLEAIAAREGIEIEQVETSSVAGGYAFAQNGTPLSTHAAFPLRSEAHPGEGSPRGFPPFQPPPGQSMMPPPPGYPAPLPLPYGYHPAAHVMPPPGYNPHIHPAFQQQSPPHASVHVPNPSTQEPRGSEPLPHDLWSTQALAKAFGVNPAIVGDLKLAPATLDSEDLAVGLTGLASRRDNPVPEDPRDPAKWISVPICTNTAMSPTVSTGSSSKLGPIVDSKPFVVWLPKDRNMVQQVIDVYFTRLNVHRPVFSRSSFESSLDALYKGTASYDPGFLCSAYLIMALGTLSDLNHRVISQELSSGSSALQKVLPIDWPGHEEFFGSALAVKPELRVTISSLQALILLHWYLYTERQGRSLWRLVGSFVRLAVELGLHHDPTIIPVEDVSNPTGQPPPPVFSEEECQLRIRLWAIVLLHDRGTSILLGRPLAIAPYDSNTPRPSASKGNGISEHFVLSAPIVEIQADIINSLYAPTRQSADSIVRNAQRITKSIRHFIRQLPEGYRYYFQDTESWDTEKRTKLVENITEDQGLTLLKIGISRILLLRALFSSKEIPFQSRQTALMDAIVTSHNVIIVHQQLIKFPDIAFFVSPIPLHIAAMVILYGHMSKCQRLSRDVALEDVWMALQMLPKFRWRWERKDMKGGHPLIATLAEQVLKVSLDTVSPTTPPMLLLEAHGDSADGALSPKSYSTLPTTPTTGPAHYSPIQYAKPSPTSGPAVIGGMTKDNGSPAQDSGRDEKLAEVPSGLFYPFFPESTGASAASILSAQPMGNYGYQPSQHSYVLEEKDPSLVQATGPGMHMWHSSTQHDARTMAPYQGLPHV